MRYERAPLRQEVVREHRRTTRGPCAVTLEDDLAVVEGEPSSYACTVAGGAEHDRTFLSCATRTGRIRHPITELGAVEVLAGDDVDHATDGIGTVDCRGAVGQDFDTLNRTQRDCVQVLCRTNVRGNRGTTTVDQDQGTARAEAAQGKTGERLCRRTRLRTERTEAVKGCVAEQVSDRNLTGQFDLFTIDDGDGQGTFQVRALDARARDFDAAFSGRGAVLGKCNAVAGGHTGGKRQ